MLLGNNMLFVVVCASVLLGTMYPLLLDALGMGKISVGAPYFETVFLPLMVPVVLLMALGPLARWKQAELPQIAKRLRWAFAIAIIVALATNGWRGKLGLVSTLGLALAFWIVAALATDLADRLRPSGIVATSVLQRARLIPRAVVGMMIAHLGIAIFIFGVTMVKTGEVERDVKMDVGDTTEIRGNIFAFRGVREVRGPNYQAVQGRIDISRDGQPLTTLRPEKRFYPVTQSTMTEASIDSGFTRDLYVSLGEPIAASKAWIVRVYYKPFVDWIWGGCFIMALGGFIAATDRRYRAKAKQSALAHGAGVAAA
jgi:cytochrome c-type biogenesis protein CcmF